MTNLKPLTREEGEMQAQIIADAALLEACREAIIEGCRVIVDEHITSAVRQAAYQLLLDVRARLNEQLKGERDD